MHVMRSAAKLTPGQVDEMEKSLMEHEDVIH
ncbi:hypothetical protein E2C01_093790 [Portunus trituberculatus]|uniref:Uncharacterized protein n=1 Tax=Portunus trituberculatus TaxID=210409 RepID=A0A5B7JUF2_PORTR|nr:hypothetical protein [Portunus trituberculatus]